VRRFIEKIDETPSSLVTNASPHTYELLLPMRVGMPMRMRREELRATRGTAHALAQ
jgi:hypothetical protein